MAESNAETAVEDESLKDFFDEGMKLFDEVDNSNEPTNSDAIQLKIKSAVAKFEKSTQLVSLLGLFSSNEGIEELPTESMRYLLLPALLGSLTLKITGQPRKDVINVAEIYFRDYIQRCKNYGVTDVELPEVSDEGQSTSTRPQSEQAKIVHMVQSREAKIKRYKEAKELKEKLQKLNNAILSPSVDDVTKREYYMTLINSYINQALDDLNSIDQEKPLLDYMAKHGSDAKHKEGKHHHHRPPPLKPVIITRDAVQKAVYGAGYPSLPTLTIEEFYDQRVREGTFPGSCNIARRTIQSADEDPDEAAKIQKEQLVENEDPEEIERQRNMDEFKDDHRRGWGNRHNRS